MTGGSLLETMKKICVGWIALALTGCGTAALSGVGAPTSAPGTYEAWVTSEAADLVVLRDGLGVEHRVPKSDIEERSQLPTSVMPEGLVSDLSIAQFASLLDYIETLVK